MIAQGASVQIMRYPNQAWGYERLLAWLHTELANIPAGSMLLAESFSGPLGILLAAENFQRFKALVLCATFARCPSRLAAVFAPSLNWLSIYTPMFPLLSLAMPQVSIEQSLFNQAVPAELRDRLAMVLKQNRTAVSQARLRAILNVDVRESLKRVEIPITYLRANQDRLVGAFCVEEMTRIKSDIEVFKFDAPHCILQVCAPEISSLLVKRFASD
jgi:pimeloyl-[acyl-carrier protein] methyl ester esterase